VFVVELDRSTGRLARIQRLRVEKEPGGGAIHHASCRYPVVY